MKNKTDLAPTHKEFIGISHILEVILEECKQEFALRAHFMLVLNFERNFPFGTLHTAYWVRYDKDLSNAFTIKIGA